MDVEFSPGLAGGEKGLAGALKRHVRKAVIGYCAQLAPDFAALHIQASLKPGFADLKPGFADLDFDRSAGKQFKMKMVKVTEIGGDLDLQVDLNFDSSRKRGR